MHTDDGESGAAPRSDVASRVARRVRSAGDRFHRPSDFPWSRTAVEKALGRLVRSGELVRVRNGLYWRGSDTPFGMSPPNPREVISVYADGFPIGPAGLSAANFLGLTTQVPRIPEYATPSRVPDIDRVRLRRRGGRRSEARRSAGLSESEVALLEVFDVWERVVEVPPGEALERIGAAVDAGIVDIAKVARAARHEPARIRERLRYVLERIGRRDLAESVPAASAESVRQRAIEPLVGVPA